MPSLSDIGEFIIDALTWRTRLVTKCQLHRFFGDGVNIERELAILERRGLVECFPLPTVVLDLEEPLFTWNHMSSEKPVFGKLCWAAESRVRQADLVNCKIYFASHSAERTFGGVGGKLRQPFQIVHDLGTTSSYLAYANPATNLRNDLQLWIGEDAIRRFYRHLNVRKIPDAAIIANDRITKVMDFVGRDYSAKQIERFHDYWSAKKITYELW